MGKEWIAIITAIIFMASLLFFLMWINYNEDHIEEASCTYMKVAEKFGYEANHSEVWNRRVECGLINDVNVGEGVA